MTDEEYDRRARAMTILMAIASASGYKHGTRLVRLSNEWQASCHHPSEDRRMRAAGISNEEAITKLAQHYLVALQQRIISDVMVFAKLSAEFPIYVDREYRDNLLHSVYESLNPEDICSLKEVKAV